MKHSRIATSIEQSKTLRKAGFGPSTADMEWNYMKHDSQWMLTVGYEDSQYYAEIPAWSLSRLIDILGTASSYNYGPMTDAGEVIDNIVDSILFLVKTGDIDPKKL